MIGLVLLCVIFSLTSRCLPYMAQRAERDRSDYRPGDSCDRHDARSIVIGGIDLSVGSILAFSMMMMGWLLPVRRSAARAGYRCGPIWSAPPAASLTGFSLPGRSCRPSSRPLTMMSVARGLANIITEGRQIVGFPEWFTNLSTVRHFRISLSNGRDIHRAVDYQLGGSTLHDNRPQPVCHRRSPEVARLAGIRVRKLVMSVYALSGLLSGLAAIALACRLNSSQPSAGLGYELDTIAAVVIGGASLNGGVGGIRGTVVGVLIIWRSTEWIEPERRFTLRSTNRNRCASSHWRWPRTRFAG